MTTMVHLFGGDATTAERSKELLGGKGSNLAEMASIGLPVPPGFTITTDVCTAYYANGEQFPAGLIEEVAAGIAHIEGITGKTFGDAADPARFGPFGCARLDAGDDGHRAQPWAE